MYRPFFNVIQHWIITVGYNNVGLAFELRQIDHYLAAEKITSIRQHQFIDDDLSAFVLDALHDTLNAAVPEVVRTALHR